MGLARDERLMAARGEGCLGRAAGDEPVFILRAQDRLMPVLLNVWIQVMSLFQGADHPKVVRAMDLLMKVHEWQSKNPTKFPD